MSDRAIEILHAPMRRLTGVRVLGTGSYVPDCVVKNEDLASLGCDPQWIVQRTGIHERRHAPPEMATSDLAVMAAERCLQRADVRPEEIDLVVLGTLTPDMLFPASACLVQTRLGINAPAMDVQAACAGFFYALVTGMQFVATGCSRRALVIGADCNSRLVDPLDVKTYPLFGDGAGAVVIAAGDSEQGFTAYTMGADGSGADLLCARAGGTRRPTSHETVEQRLHYMYMDGKPVFKWAVRLLEQSVNDVCQAAGMTLDQLDHIVLHQANSRIIDAAMEALGIDRDKVAINLDRYGNTSAASIPLALDELCQQGRIRRGSNVLMSGFGGGLAWGTGIFRW